MTTHTPLLYLGLFAIVLSSGCSTVSLKPVSRTVPEALAEDTVVTIPMASELPDGGTTNTTDTYVPGPYDNSLVPEKDEDGDGLSNFAEHVTGTNPRDKQSRPVIRQLNISSNSFQFDVSTLPGRLYTIEYNSDLQSPDWLVLTNHIGNGAVLSVNTASDDARRYYRFKVRLE